MKKLRMLLLGCMLLGGVAAFAGEKEKLAEELLVLTGIPNTIAQMPEEINKRNTEMLKKSIYGSAIAKDDLAELQKKVVFIAGKYFNWESMKEEYTELYAANYTEEELKAIIAFMKTPAGTKWREKGAVITTKKAMLNQARMKKAMAEIITISKELIEKTRAEAKDKKAENKVEAAKTLAAPIKK